MLRTDVLAKMLLERLLRLGAMSEPSAVMLIESRALGRGDDVIAYARRAGMLKRTPATETEPAMLEAVGTPRSLAA